MILNLLTRTRTVINHAYHVVRFSAYPWFVRFGKRVGWWKLSAVAGVLIGIVGTLIVRGLPDTAAPIERLPRSVEVRSIRSLAAESSPLAVVGTVRSQSQADVRTESSGEVTGVYRSLGDFVSAGTVLAELENSRERASVLQSQGAVDAAQAQLSKVRRGGREEQAAILQANVESAQNSLASAKTSSVNALVASYASIDDAVRHKTDPLFANPDSSTPDFTVQTNDAAAVTNAETQRVKMTAILAREQAASSMLNESSNLKAEFTTADTELRATLKLLDAIIAALNKAVPSQALSDATIASYKSDATLARTSINGALASLTAAADSLASKQSALEVAQKNLEQGVTSDEPDVAAAEAALKQAQGALAAARANLEKTIVRSPISGTINALPLHKGDFVASFTPAASIANNGALEIVAYVTDTEAKELAVGTEVEIEGDAKGVITHIAPALDPVTKKIDVRIGVSAVGSLVNGQAVTINFKRSSASAAVAPTPTRLIIPISALKVGSDKIVVFTVTDDAKLVSHVVTIGTLLGDRVEITSGIDADTEIVLDARGLKEGDTVTIKQ